MIKFRLLRNKIRRSYKAERSLYTRIITANTLYAKCKSHGFDENFDKFYVENRSNILFMTNSMCRKKCLLKMR